MFATENSASASVTNSALAAWDGVTIGQVMDHHEGHRGATYGVPFDGDTIAKLTNA